MARIDAVTSASAETAIQSTTERNRKGSQQNEVFSRQVKERSKASWQEYMSELQGKILDQGKKLGERMDLSELFKYRTLVTAFFRETVDNGFSFDSESSFNARNRNKVFSTVKIVNEEIDEIARQLVSEQQDQLDVLERIDSIRGLILDMLL